jgi:ribonuclease HII
MALVIGLDESGTGSWAGPFHVGAVACEVLPFNREVGRSLKDSKKLSDAVRRKLVPKIKANSIAFVTVEVSVPEIAQGARAAWRKGVSGALLELWSLCCRGCVSSDDLANATLLIDGPIDYPVMKVLKKLHPDPTFVIGADTRFPVVMAAAILAKTARNDAMTALDGLYPEFDWKSNAGYGVPAHLEACRKYGITPQHRAIARLDGFPVYRPQGWWDRNVTGTPSEPPQDAREEGLPHPGPEDGGEVPGVV